MLRGILSHSPYLASTYKKMNRTFIYSFSMRSGILCSIPQHRHSKTSMIADMVPAIGKYLEVVPLIIGGVAVLVMDNVSILDIKNCAYLLACFSPATPSVNIWLALECHTI